LLLTGTFLTLFFQPSMTDVVYHGSYHSLDGVRMSEAYASTLNISFGLRVLYGVLLAIPVVGSYLAFFLFGGAYPGNDIIPRLYILHVLVIPGLLLALISAHLLIMVFQKHTQMPGKGRTNSNVVGQPMYPYFMAKIGAFFFFFTFAALALASTFAQIDPIWLYGPYTPAVISAGSAVGREAALSG